MVHEPVDHGGDSPLAPPPKISAKADKGPGRTHDEGARSERERRRRRAGPRPPGRTGCTADLVDDEQRDPSQLARAQPREPALTLGRAELQHPLVSGGEGDPEPRRAARTPSTIEQVTLPAPGGPRKITSYTD